MSRHVETLSQSDAEVLPACCAGARPTSLRSAWATTRRRGSWPAWAPTRAATRSPSTRTSEPACALGLELAWLPCHGASWVLILTHAHDMASHWTSQQPHARADLRELRLFYMPGLCAHEYAAGTAVHAGSCLCLRPDKGLGRLLRTPPCCTGPVADSTGSSAACRAAAHVPVDF